MSEINVDQAFDPQARQAQAELDAYMQSRPYMDANGTAHNPDNNQFINTDKHFDAARDAHYDETQAERDYENMSMTTLAKELGQAELDNDKTRTGDIEDVLYAKMDSFMEKAKEANGPNRTEEDNTIAGNNLLERIMGVKEAYKASKTTPATTTLPQRTPRSGNTASTEDQNRGREFVTLEDQARATQEAAQAARAAGDTDEADRLDDERANMLADMARLVNQGVERPADNENGEVDASVEAQRAVFAEAMRAVRTEAEAARDAARAANDLAAYEAAMDRLAEVENQAVVLGIDLDEVTEAPEDDGTELHDHEAEEQDDEVDEDDELEEVDTPNRLNRIRNRMRNWRVRATARANGLNLNDIEAEDEDGGAPVDPEDPDAEPGEVDEDEVVERRTHRIRNGIIGAVAVVAAGYGIYKGIDYFQHLNQGSGSGTADAVRKGVVEGWLKSDSAKKYFDGLREVQKVSGIKLGQPGFDDAVKRAAEFADKLPK